MKKKKQDQTPWPSRESKERPPETRELRSSWDKRDENREGDVLHVLAISYLKSWHCNCRCLDKISGYHLTVTQQAQRVTASNKYCLYYWVEVLKLLSLPFRIRYSASGTSFLTRSLNWTCHLVLLSNFSCCQECVEHIRDRTRPLCLLSVSSMVSVIAYSGPYLQCNMHFVSCEVHVYSHNLGVQPR